MTIDKGDDRREVRRQSDIEKNEVIRQITHTNPALRPVRRIYVGVLFSMACLAIAISYFALQHYFEKQNRKIQVERWESVYRQCTETNARHDNSLTFLATLGEQQVKKASPAKKATVKKQVKTSLGEYQLLFQALAPKRSDCQSYATRITHVHPSASEKKPIVSDK